MRYFKNNTTGEVFGYDATQGDYISAATVSGLIELAIWPLPKNQAEIDAESTSQALAALREIDLASIRSIREYIGSKPDAPQWLKDREAAAQAERAKLKP